MKVLVIPSWYPSKNYPNNGIFFKEQTEALKRKGIDVTVLCIEIPYRKAKKEFSYIKKNYYIENGIPVYRYVFPVGILHKFPKVYYAFLKFVSERIYVKEFKEKGYDVIQAHSFLIGGYSAICLKKTFNCKCIITEHTSKILMEALNKVEKEKLKECVNESDEFVCVSNNLKKYVQKITKTQKEILVQPNMVSDLFKSGKKTKDSFRFVSIGNLIPLKRMDLLIEAFCDAFSKEQDVSIDIYGDGPEYKRLENIIYKKDRKNQIILHGSVSREEIAQALQQSHVMALVSEKETFGVAYIEALASGNIIVGFKNGGADDIVTERNGILLSSDNVEAVSEALKKVKEEYERYNIEEIRKECKSLYGEESFSEMYIRCFENVKRRI
mgnify:CR=1 FL=1